MTENFVKRKYVHGLQFAPFSCEWTLIVGGVVLPIFPKKWPKMAHFENKLLNNRKNKALEAKDQSNSESACQEEPFKPY